MGLHKQVSVSLPHVKIYLSLSKRLRKFGFCKVVTKGDRPLLLRGSVPIRHPWPAPLAAFPCITPLSNLFFRVTYVLIGHLFYVPPGTPFAKNLR